MFKKYNYSIYRFLYIFSYFLFSKAIVVIAQHKKDLNYYSAKKFNTCEQLLERKKYDEAIQCLEQGLLYCVDKTKYNVRLAELYYLKKNVEKTLYYSNQAIDNDANEAYNPLQYLTQKMHNNSDDSIAMLIMNRLSVSKVKAQKLNSIEKTRDKLILKQTADKSVEATRKLISLGDSINSIESEYMPSTTLDDKIMIFTRRTQGANEDFFVSYKDTNGIWTKAKNIGYPPNTSNPEGGAKISADGHYLFFTRCDMKSPDGIVGGGCDIVYCYKDDTIWSSPEYFGYTINTTAFEGHPCLSSNNKDLYFASNREGGFGGMDLYVSHFNDNGYWTKPQNLGASINTSGNETTPFIHADNETFYFSSDGQVGFGLSDIFMSKKINDSTWTKPINMGYPINSEKYDAGLVVSANGKYGYIGSDNTNTKGLSDLFKIELNNTMKPIPTVCFKGKVIDKKKRKYLKNIEVNILDENRKKIVDEQYSNRGDASFMFALHRKKNYYLKVSATGYRDYVYLLPFANDSIEDVTFKKVKLKEIGVLDTLFQYTLHLDSSKSNIDSNSRYVLDSIKYQWSKWKEDEANINIYLYNQYTCLSDTDSTCNDAINNTLSQMEIIKKHLINEDITCDCINEKTTIYFKKEEKDVENGIEIYIVEFY